MVETLDSKKTDNFWQISKLRILLSEKIIEIESLRNILKDAVSAAQDCFYYKVNTYLDPDFYLLSLKQQKNLILSDYRKIVNICKKYQYLNKNLQTNHYIILYIINLVNGLKKDIKNGLINNKGEIITDNLEQLDNSLFLRISSDIKCVDNFKNNYELIKLLVDEIKNNKNLEYCRNIAYIPEASIKYGQLNSYKYKEKQK